MNILFLTSGYVSPYKGGVDKVTFLLHNEFIKKGINSLCNKKVTFSTPPLYGDT